MLTPLEIQVRIRILEDKIINISESDIFLMDEQYDEITDLRELIDDLKLLIEYQNVSAKYQIDSPSTTSLYSHYLSRVSSLDASENFRNSLLPNGYSCVAHEQKDKDNDPVAAEQIGLRSFY